MPSSPQTAWLQLPHGVLLLAGLAIWVLLLLGGDAGGRAVRAAGEDSPSADPPSDPVQEAPAIDPSSGTASGSLRPALLAGLQHLRDVPGSSALDPRAHPPVFESARAGALRARLRWRQELEMDYGTLVALYRGVLDLRRDRSGGPWRVVGEGHVAKAPPRGAGALPQRVSRALQRELETAAAD